MKQPPQEPNATPMLDCDGLIAQIWDYLDHELSAERLRAVEAHLSECSQCTGHVTFERTVLHAIKSARADAIDTERLGHRVRQALERAGFSDPR